MLILTRHLCVEMAKIMALKRLYMLGLLASQEFQRTAETFKCALRLLNWYAHVKIGCPPPDLPFWINACHFCALRWWCFFTFSLCQVLFLLLLLLFCCFWCFSVWLSASTKQLRRLHYKKRSVGDTWKTDCVLLQTVGSHEFGSSIQERRRHLNIDLFGRWTGG